MNQELLKNYANELLKLILNVTKKKDTGITGRLEYNGKAVLIEDDFGTRFWLRLMLNKDEKLVVYFSTVEFREELRRCGLFSEICKNVKEASFIGSAVISNVCTRKMSNFCHKHEFEFIESINAYKIK